MNKTTNVETGLSATQSQLDRAAGDKPKRAPRPRRALPLISNASRSLPSRKSRPTVRD